MTSAVSLFSGAGGMDIGIRQAGFDILACVERDLHCCDTLRSAISREKHNTLVIEGDIRELDPVDLLAQIGLERGELDLLFGGPPCQAFSQIGKRHSIADERGMLLFEMVRFAEVIQPRVILIEQVKGLLNAPDHDGKPGGVLEMLLNDLESLGYIPKWKTINTADYGVPQLRKRIFIVCTLERNDFQFPTATHAPLSNITQLPLFSLTPYETVGNALRGLSSPPLREDYNGEDSHVNFTPAGDKRRIHGVPEGAHLASQLHLPSEQRCNLSKKDTTKFRRMNRNEPAITLRCGEIFFHPIEDRYLTIREYMRIHTYPDDYLLKGPMRGRSGQVKNLDQYRQVANSVPPRIAWILAKAIREVIECQLSLNSSATPYQTIV